MDLTQTFLDKADSVLQALRRRQRDFDDLQDAIASRDTGRMRKFLNTAAQITLREERQREARRFLSRLQELLEADPVYAATYQRTMDRLGELERAAERARDILGNRLRAAEDTLTLVLENAARLPDGRPVFRDRDGYVRGKSGSIVGADDAASILWRGDEPSYEDYVAARDVLDASRAALRDIEDYQTNILGNARNRLMDEDDPPSMEELKSIEYELIANMPEVVEDFEHANGSGTRSDGPTATIIIPKM